MAEYFSRATLSPDSYNSHEWTILHEIKTNTTGALIFDFSITNTTDNLDITVEAKIVDLDGNIVHYILGPTVLKSKGISWDSRMSLAA